MDPTNRNTALASALVEELARCGVTRAVVCPGSRSTPIALALLREPAIQTISIVDERSGGFFALGAANATRRPVVVACTSGTAAANLHPAVCEADEAGVPILVLTSDRPPELRGVGAGQTIDQVKLYGSAVRWFCEVGTHDADDAGLLHHRRTACRAYAAALGDPRPGPVHLNLSWRDPLGPEPVEAAVTARTELALRGRPGLPATELHRPVMRLADDAVEAVAQDLAETPRGVIVAGRQPDPALGQALAKLAGATGYPILAEPTSQVRMGTHPREAVVWAYDAIARSRPQALDPDLVIRFGDMPTSKPLRRWLEDLDAAAQLVVDPTGSWSEPTRRAGLLLRAEPVALADDLASRLSRLGSAARTWADLWARAGDAAAREIEAELGGIHEPTEPGVHWALAEAYADGELVYTASSMPIRDQESFLRAAHGDVLFLSNRGANGIDGTVSSAIGAAAASGRPGWLIIGDLALHHDSNGLAALRHCPVPVRVVVLNNDGGGIFEFLPQADQVSRSEFESIFGTPLGLDTSRLAALYDVEFHRLAEIGHLAGLPRDRHLIAEVRVDRTANLAVHRAIWESATQAIRIALDAPGPNGS